MRRLVLIGCMVLAVGFTVGRDYRSQQRWRQEQQWRRQHPVRTVYVASPSDTLFGPVRGTYGGRP